jgi:signal transduction histidine kinase
VVQDQLVRSLSQSIDDEVRGSFAAYESIWQARASHLASLSLLLSRMPDVRAAFGTGDRLTIRDSAAEIWSKVAAEGGMFLVTDPRGRILASLGGFRPEGAQDLAMVRKASARFPNQVSGFLAEGGRLYQTVVTPVYVDATGGSALINVLVAGYEVTAGLANSLKQATGGSDFIFLKGRAVVASSLPVRDAGALGPVPAGSGQLPHVRAGDSDYALFASPLRDVEGNDLGELLILRSFDSATRRLAELRRNLVVVWVLAVLSGLLLTYFLANRILRPVKALDAAAAEVSRGNYSARVEVNGSDELGRLARTFNGMAESIRAAREELIRQERLFTISRLSTSIIHDLRNPLAAIYAGAEMLLDGELPPQQIRRLASNIYRSSHRVQSLLSDMADVTRGGSHTVELSSLKDIVESAQQAVAAEADLHGIRISNELPDNEEVIVDRSRIQRVFENLLLNAIEAMGPGGTVKITSSTGEHCYLVSVQDDGPGISREIAGKLFEPFATSGKKKGMGLGLALSRQTVRDHGGDLWAESAIASGAKFVVKLPA